MVRSGLSVNNSAQPVRQNPLRFSRTLKGLKGLRVIAAVEALAHYITCHLEVIGPGVIENIETRGDSLFWWLHAAPVTPGLLVFILSWIAIGIVKSRQHKQPEQPRDASEVSEVSEKSCSLPLKTVNERPAPKPVQPTPEEVADTVLSESLSCTTEPSAADIIIERAGPESVREGILYSKIGPYKVLKKIGEGGFGTVYLGEQKSKVLKRIFRERVAIKVMPIDNGDHVGRYLEEINALSELNHPNIVAFRSCGENKIEKIIIVFTEYIDGKTIDDIVKEKGVLEVSNAASIVIECARALEYALKSKEFIHRDIKPDNIMVQHETEYVKVVDLGLVRRLEGGSLTRPGTLIGTAKYMAPERILLEPVDFRSDIYSLGATLFFMLAGRAPFEGKGEERYLKHIREPVPDIREFNPEVPEGLWKVIQKMLAKEPADRHESYRALIKDLSRFV